MKPPLEYRPKRPAPKTQGSASGSVPSRTVPKEIIAEVVKPLLLGAPKPAKKTKAAKAPSKPKHRKAKASEPSTFDRTTYQRDYMRDLRAAKKLGLTVKEYRLKQKDSK